MTSRSALPRQSDFSGRFTLVAVHYFHVSLSRGYALMSHHTLYGTDIGPCSSLQGCECSTIRMECYILCDSGRTNPFLHGNLGPAPFQTFEYQTLLLR